MSIMSRLNNSGRLLISNEFNERLPIITSSLLAHFPFDNSLTGIVYRNPINYSTWNVGDTSATGFTRNGTTSENLIITGTDPFGSNEKLWMAYNSDTNSNDDGGWGESIIHPIDNTYMYRFSEWVNAYVPGTSSIDGRIYHGLYGRSGSTNVGVLNRSNLSNNTNPYFSSNYSYLYPQNEWVLFVGHVWPTGTNSGSSYADSGAYRLNGQKLTFHSNADYIWRSDNNNVTQRTYLYYCVNNSIKTYWCYPRIEKCDGTQSTIQNLLNCEGNVINVLTASNITLLNDGILVEETTSNITSNYTRDIYPSYNNSWGTCGTELYNSNLYFDIGPITSVSGNIVTTLNDHPFRTYSVINSNTGSGGITASTNYFVKKISSTQFALCPYTSSQNGTLGWKVHNSVINNQYITINSSSFPTMWKGNAHLANSMVLKEIIENGYLGIHDCMRIHHFRDNDLSSTYSTPVHGMAYGVTPSIVSGSTYTVSFKYRTTIDSGVGVSVEFSRYTDGEWQTLSSFILDKEWKQYYYTFTTSKTGVTNFYWLKTHTKPFSWDFAEFQLEQKSYMTSFTTGSRSAGYLKLSPNLIDINTGGYSFDFFYQGLKYSDNSNKWMMFTHAYSGSSNEYNKINTCIYDNKIFTRFADNTGSTWNSSGYTTSSLNIDNWNTYSITWNKSSNTVKESLNGIITEQTPTILPESSQSYFYIGTWGLQGLYSNTKIKNLSIYNKTLTNEELYKLSNVVTSINVNNFIDKELIETEGWTYIYGGPHFYLSNEDNQNDIDFEYDPKSNLNNIYFNMMMIKPRYFNMSDNLPFIIGSFDETCVLKEKYRYYTKYLHDLPDSGVSGSKLVCHSAQDGLLDVTSSTNYLGNGYGNSWRRYGNMWYVNDWSTGSSLSYLNNYDDIANIQYSEWGASYADGYITLIEALNNVLTESGSGYNLTPLKSSIIDVYVKSGSDVDYEMSILKNKLKLKRELFEGEVL